jgi:hypothetical protein
MAGLTLEQNANHRCNVGPADPDVDLADRRFRFEFRRA